VSALIVEEEGTAHLMVAWETVLDRLETDVRISEQMLADLEADLEIGRDAGVGTWTPLAVDGPLPEALVGRARELERRQAALREGLVRAMAETRAGLARVRRTAFAEATTAPAYVDVSA
jgi:hypothetical protein